MSSPPTPSPASRARTAVATAVAAAVLLDHYFIPPLDNVAVAGPDNVVTLVAFVLVAGAASSVVGLAARRREAEALATANDLRFLRWGGVGLKPTTQGL